MNTLFSLDESVAHIFDKRPLPTLSGSESILVRAVGKTRLDELELWSHYRGASGKWTVTEWGEFMHEIEKKYRGQAEDVDVLLEVSDLMFYRAAAQHSDHRNTYEQQKVVHHIDDTLNLAYRLCEFVSVDITRAETVAQIKYTSRAQRGVDNCHPFKDKSLERSYAQQFLETTTIPDAF